MADKFSASEFRQKMRDSFVLGPFCKSHDPALIEIAGAAGFDFVILDLEHGPNSVETLQNLLRAAQCAGVFPIVRVKEGNMQIIGEVLDIGAGGIQVPQVVSAEEAEKVAQSARFAPQGMRGVCRFVRAAGYSSMDRYEYFKKANESVIILQIEGKEALDNVESILSKNIADVLFIGPYDLSQSMGVPGNIDHPLVVGKMEWVVETCKRYGVCAGTFVDTEQNAVKWIDMGVKYVSYSVDMGIYYDACRGISDRIKSVK